MALKAIKSELLTLTFLVTPVRLKSANRFLKMLKWKQQSKSSSEAIRLLHTNTKLKKDITEK